MLRSGRCRDLTQALQGARARASSHGLGSRAHPQAHALRKWELVCFTLVRLSHFYKLGLAFPQGPDDLSLCSTAMNGKEGDRNQGVYSIIRFVEKFSVPITCACVGKNPTGKDTDGLQPRYARALAP